jgi:hypothetical protein
VTSKNTGTYDSIGDKKEKLQERNWKYSVKTRFYQSITWLKKGVLWSAPSGSAYGNTEVAFQDLSNCLLVFQIFGLPIF